MEKKSIFRWAYMLAFVIFTAVFSVVFPDNSVPLWLALVTAELGIISTVWFAQKNIWAYAPSFIFNFMYMYVCWKSRLWLEFGEYIFYNVTMIYGIVVWKKRLEDDKTHVKPKKMSTKAIIWSCIATAVATALFGLIDKFVLNGAVPFLDAFTISFTIIAQILIVLCYREQWLFWFILDIASCFTFALTKNWAIFAMYVCWTLNCVYGWWEWSKNEKAKE